MQKGKTEGSHPGSQKPASRKRKNRRASSREKAHFPQSGGLTTRPRYARINHTACVRLEVRLCAACLQRVLQK